MSLARFGVAIALSMMLMAVAIIILAHASRAYAHANLVRSEPAANAERAVSPSAVALYFSEEPELRSTELSVRDTGQRRWEQGDVRRLEGNGVGVDVAELPNGTYTVVWKTVSAVDGHVTRGAFAFGVGESSQQPLVAAELAGATGGGPPRWLSAIARWSAYLSMYALMGAAAFPALVLARTAVNHEMASEPVRKRVALVLAFALATLLLSTATIIALQAWASSGSASSLAGELPGVVFHTRYGHVWLVRACATTLAFPAAAMFMRRPARGRDITRLPALAPLLALAVLLPLTMSLNSHSASDLDAAWLTTTGDWLHQVAGGFWIGGLIQMVVVLPAALARVPSRDRGAALGSVIARFSPLAATSVAVIVATGTLQWWQIVGNVHETIASAYGRALIVKVALLMPLLAGGAFNLLIARPGLAGHGSTPGAASERLARRFWVIVSVEASIALAILVCTSVLTTGSPPFVASSTGFSGDDTATRLTSQAGDLRIAMVIRPGAAGRNDIEFSVDSQPDASHAIERFIVRFTYLDDRLGTTQDDASAVRQALYALSGSQLSLPGRWKIDTVVRRAGLDDVQASFEVSVRAP
jgi:copper transport protein